MTLEELQEALLQEQEKNRDLQAKHDALSVKNKELEESNKKLLDHNNKLFMRVTGEEQKSEPSADEEEDAEEALINSIRKTMKERR